MFYVVILDPSGGKIDELSCVVKANDVHIVCVQESWLDASVPNPVLPNFVIVSRRDRSQGSNRGGIITYARSDVNNIVEFKKSAASERSWHIVQRDTGSLAICNWYFSPSGEAVEIDTLVQEIDEISSQVDEILIVGDFNIHHASWLRFSSGTHLWGYHHDVQNN